MLPTSNPGHDSGATIARSGAETVQHLRQALDAALYRVWVPLGLDAGPQQLQVEHAVVSGVEHLAQQPFERDVAVAGHRTIRRVEGADGEVRHLHEPDAIDVRSHGL